MLAAKTAANRQEEDFFKWDEQKFGIACAIAAVCATLSIPPTIYMRHRIMTGKFTAPPLAIEVAIEQRAAAERAGARERRHLPCHGNGAYAMIRGVRDPKAARRVAARDARRRGKTCTRRDAVCVSGRHSPCVREGDAACDAAELVSCSIAHDDDARGVDGKGERGDRDDGQVHEGSVVMSDRTSSAACHARTPVKSAI